MKGTTNKTPGGRDGVTLLEIIVVGAIIGILAGIAVPIYLSFLKRARQVEAPVALNEIKRLESLYYSFSGTFGTLEEIGYRADPSLRYFTMTLELTPSGSGNPTGYLATAQGNVDSDAELDIWTITDKGTPQHAQAD